MRKILSKKDIKTLGLSSLGGTLEFYDFIIFAFFSSYISKNFFPENLSPFWQLFNTYGIFAAAYVVRPLGGIVMAHFGDKFGRKKMFMLSILLMVIPTFALAFIPSYESIGYLCVVFLMLIRIAQGISIGGELPGAWIFVYEHSPQGQRRTYIGFLTASVVGGTHAIYANGKWNCSSISSKIFGLVWGLGFGGIPWAGLVLPELKQEPVYLIGYGVGLLCILVMVICLKYLPKRTPYGNEILGKLKGFKNFLETAEKEKLEAMVMEDPTYFYNILSYAYVLGVSDKWIKKFESISLQAPSWYDSPNTFDMRTFESFMDSTMTSAQSNMSSSNSGGSSGGGSSGGGSGGGGGGSW